MSKSHSVLRVFINVFLCFHRTGSAAQIRNQVSTAFSSVDGPDGKPTILPSNQASGTLMLTQSLISAGIGSRVHPVLVNGNN